MKRHGPKILPAVGYFLLIRSATKCNFKGLFAVQSGINLRPIGPFEIAFREVSSAPGAFGDVFAGQFEMHTTEMGAHSFVHANRAFNFTENVIEMAGLSSRRGGHRVAVHGVAHPDHLSAIGLDAFDQPFQTFVDRLHPKAVHQDQTSRVHRRDARCP